MSEGQHLPDERQLPYAWKMVAVLTGCYLVSMIDRYVVNLLLHPIAASLKLTDVQISLVVGFSFTFFYATVGLLLGPLVDRYNRKLIIMVGIVIWTAATAATAFAPNYGTLLVARILVGAGEAALAPAAYSLIAEAFPRQKLSRPTTIFFLGGAIGPGVSLVLAALALGWADLLNQSGSLGFLQNESWRFVILLAAAPGLIALAAVAFGVPDRRGFVAPLPVDGTLWTELRTKPLLYLGFMGGTAAVSIYINAVAAWWPTYALRTFGWPLSEGGVYFGIALAIGALAGIFSGGTLSNVLMRKHGDTGNGMALAGLAIASTPLLIFCTLVASPNVQLVLVTVALAAGFAINGLAPVACQLAAGPNMRGRVSALYVASATIIGAGLGPVAAASLEKVSIGGTKVGFSGAFAILGAVCGLVMIAGFSLYWRQLRAMQSGLTQGMDPGDIELKGGQAKR